MWKTAFIWVSLLVAIVIGGPLPIVSAEENQLPEAKVLEGHMASYSGHPASFDGKHSVPVFENDVGKLFAVTKLEKVSRDKQIKFLWFFKDQIIHETTLPLRANQMRAQSELNLKTKWTGSWRVDVTSGDGTLLYSIPFIVRRKPETVQASSPAPIMPNEEGNPSPVSTSTESTTVP
jgi:hypothetical protein